MEVELLTSTPNPENQIARAARNDYMSEWVAEKKFADIFPNNNPQDGKKELIHHLLKHHHFGPFEHVQATFAIKGVSRVLMAQLTRHRHATFDVQSMRYVPFDDVDPQEAAEGELIVTPHSVTDEDWIGRNQKDVDDPQVEKREDVFRRSVRQSVEDYQELLELGMPPEDARFVLPLGTKVNIVMSLNVRMLMHIADMRAAGDAQWEIREMTEEVLDIAEDWCPITFQYYENNMKNRKNRLAP